MNTQSRRRGRPSSSRGNSARAQNSRGPRQHRGNRSFRKGGRGPRKMATFDVSKYINKNPVQSTQEEEYAPTHSFADFALADALLGNITKSGITSPTPIQDEIIPHILKGKDVVGLANTGTGKTAAFLVPLIHQALENPKRTTLILTPTRELAIQVEQEFRKLARGMKLYAVVCVGGANIRPQLKNLRQHNNFIIGTPGRVIDLMKRKALRTEDVQTVVLDEADRMLDMGFIHDMRTIMKNMPKDRETLFFSATMSPSIEKLVSEFLRNPEKVSVKKKDITSNIEQDVVRYQNDDKFNALIDLLIQKDFSKVLVFGAMKHAVERLSNELTKAGIAAESIHGNKSHGQRQRALKRFKDGDVQVLVATDVAARGIHVDDVSHVINYDLPATYEDYVHRIGRTGRGTKQGKALTFVR